MTSQTEGPPQDPHRQEPLIARLKNIRMRLWQVGCIKTDTDLVVDINVRSLLVSIWPAGQDAIGTLH